MVVCMAKFKARAGMEQELEDIFTAFVPKVQDEAGTLMYTVHRANGSGNEGLFMFYECYQNNESFEYHSSTPYFQELFSKISSIIDGEPQIEIYEDIASINR